MTQELKARLIHGINPVRDPYSDKYLKEYEKYVIDAAEKIWNLPDHLLMSAIIDLLSSYYHSYENIQSDRDPIEMIKEEYKL